MTEIISELTPEQEALIPVYREKWRKIALSTERIDREKAAESVKAVYVFLGKPEPEIIFCNSPNAGYEVVIQRQVNQTLLHNEFTNNLLLLLDYELSSQVANQVNYQLVKQIDRIPGALSRLENILFGQVESELILETYLDNPWWQAQLWTSICSGMDFRISVLHCIKDMERWQLLHLLVNYCNWILPYEKICIICDRPTKLHFDNENRLHAEGKPAIEFADGYSLYSYHGVTLPEKYGKIHPHFWESQWLLSENNAELRRVLIQGIGYDRIASELQARELDAWAEYSLLKIDADVDDEPIHLLKMTCPSTGFIHALRVPPDTQSAREAIRWVNWGIDPEEFQQQS